MTKLTSPILSLEEAIKMAPSIGIKRLTGTQKENLGLSDQYTFVDTTNIIKTMADSGWNIVKATSAGIKPTLSAGKENFTKHTLTFRHSTTKELKVGGVFPEVIIQNSHNGKAAFKLHAGLHRLACENGLVVPYRVFEQFKTQHRHMDIPTIENFTKLVSKQLPVIGNQIRLMEGITMSEGNQREMALEALALRFVEYANEFDHSINRKQLLKDFKVEEIYARQRDADRSNDLWTTFNVIQEHIIKGGFTLVRSKSRIHSPRPAQSLVKEKSDAFRVVKLNKELWNLADKYMKQLN